MLNFFKTICNTTYKNIHYITPLTAYLHYLQYQTKRLLWQYGDLSWAVSYLLTYVVIVPFKSKDPFKHKFEFFRLFLFQDSLLKKAVIVSVALQAGLKQFVNKFHWLLLFSILTNQFTYKFPLITWISRIPATFTKLWCSGLKTSERTILQFVLHKLEEMRRKLDNRLPQWTG